MDTNNEFSSKKELDEVDPSGDCSQAEGLDELEDLTDVADVADSKEDGQPWGLYLLRFSYPHKIYTYVGVTPSIRRRLRQHNGIIKGGARYTTNIKSRYPQYEWQCVCYTVGFQTTRQCLQAEWANKGNSLARKWRTRHKLSSWFNDGRKAKAFIDRSENKITWRLKTYLAVLNMPQWSKAAPVSSTVPLRVQWWQPQFQPREEPRYLAQHITEQVMPKNYQQDLLQASSRECNYSSNTL